MKTVKGNRTMINTNESSRIQNRTAKLGEGGGERVRQETQWL